MISAADASGSSWRTLLVEDNPGDIELVRAAMNDRGGILDVATDGEIALSVLRGTGAHRGAQRPDLILLDLKIPRVGGLEVLEQLDADPDLRDIPVVVLTSSRAPSDLARAYELNARAVFEKPARGLRELLAGILGFFSQALPAPGSDVKSRERRGAPRVVLETPEELRQVRHLAAIVGSAADAIIGVDNEGSILSWNDAAEHLYGYGRHEAIGRHLRLIVPETRIDELNGILEGVRQGEAVHHLRTVRVTHEGQEVHVELTVSPIRDGTGAVVGSAAIARDISEQKRAEDRFRLAVEASPSAMIMVDEQGRIVLLNAEGERLFGYAREELIGRSVDLLVPERMRGGHPMLRAGFVKSPEARPMGAGRELFGLRKDRTEVPVEIGLNPIVTPDGTFVLSSIVDISERRQAEEKFRLAVEASPSGIAMVGQDGTILLINAEAERMFGYDRGELVNQSIDLLVPERFRGQHTHHRASFLTSPEARVMGTGRDLYGVRKDGTEFPVEVGLNPIDTPDARVVLSTIVDITARKRSEEALAHQSAELERSNEELEQFAYAASHDLQEPLRMVASFTELLAEHYGEHLDERGLRYIRYAQDGAQRMGRLIQDLLAYSRVRTRGGELVAVDLGLCIARATENLRVAIRESGAVIEHDIEARVFADETQLTLVCQNLLSNAIKFCDAAAPEIHLSARRKGDHYLIAVRDNGIGIEPEYVDRVFQMFDRLHTSEEYPGNGVGLALCRRVVERHGGKIWVESDGVRGSTFVFTLRAAPDP